MEFEYKIHPHFNFAKDFVKYFSLHEKDGWMVFPKHMGKGRFKRIAINPDFTCGIHRYQLKEDFLIKRLPPDITSDRLTFVFYNQDIPISDLPNKKEILHSLEEQDATIQIASPDLATKTFFPKDKEIHYILIGIERKELQSLLKIPISNYKILQHIIDRNQTFYYCEEITDDIEFELKNLMLIDPQKKLSTLAYQMSLERILYFLFQNLLAREDKSRYPINKEDANKIAEIRTVLKRDISTPPQLSDLAQQAGMSQTKMKKLFKQVYGNTIYRHYQKIRMQKAAGLLKHEEFTVTDVGYELGFSNLSHFTRLFKRHYGVTPKAYTKTR